MLRQVWVRPIAIARAAPYSCLCDDVDCDATRRSGGSMLNWLCVVAGCSAACFGKESEDGRLRVQDCAGTRVLSFVACRSRRCKIQRIVLAGCGRGVRRWLLLPERVARLMPAHFYELRPQHLPQ